jgi:hypothetical protein
MREPIERQRAPKVHHVEINVESKTAVSVAGTGFKAGLSKTKGWFQKVFTASNVRQANGKLAEVTRSMKRKRFGNWYSEKVVDSESGAAIHECEEPLDVHRGHGSDKPELKAARLGEGLVRSRK